MNPSENDESTSSQRYYANQSEQAILIWGLQSYFSLPERSQNRNKIAKQISSILQRYSPHWSHRSVRLWFNNNKHTFFQPDNKINPINPSINKPPLSFNPNLNDQKVILSPLTPQTNKQIENPINENKIPNITDIDSIYSQIIATLNTIYRYNDQDQNISQYINIYETLCNNILSLNGNCLPEKIEKPEKFINFPQHIEIPAEIDFNSDLIPSASELTLSRLISFGSITYDKIDINQNFDTNIQYNNSNNIYQTRHHQDKNLPNINSSFINDEYTIISYLDYISIYNNENFNDPIKNQFPSNSYIDQITLNKNKIF